MSLVCRADRLQMAVGALSGVTPESTEACSEPPAYRVLVEPVTQDGFEVYVTAVLCVDHERVAQLSAGYAKAWKLRTSAVT